LSKAKDNNNIELTKETQVIESRKILEKIEDGRNRVKKDERMLKNNFYSRFIQKNNLGEKFKNIMEEEGFDEIIIDISDLLPDDINKIQVENKFIYLDKSLIEDNLERIKDYKNKKKD